MFETWSADGKAVQVIDLRRDDAVQLIRDFYGQPDERPLLEVLGHAVRLGAVCAVQEPRYFDADWRNEHSSFYSTTFRRYPSVAHRLHFFAKPVPDVDERGSQPFLFRGLDYLGYTVLRPIRTAPVGRTLLRANESVLRQSVVCLARDRVNLLGSDLIVEGVPFYSQDSQLSRCAQTTMLMTSYFHHLTFGRPRHLPSEIADAVAGTAAELGRALPSPGLNIAQIAEAASAIGLPAVTHSVQRLAATGDDLEATICRYLNSRLPVTVATAGHAFVVVGYERKPNADGGQDIRFLRQDDEVGPYQWVENWREDVYGPWQYLIVPLPQKVYLTGKHAEDIGKTKILAELAASDDPNDEALLARYRESGRPLSWRSSVVPSNYLKRSVSSRRLPPSIAAAYQFAHLSRFVWVVEMTDRTLRDDRRPPVYAEAVIDATAHESDPRPLVWRTPGRFGMYVPDTEKTLTRTDLKHQGPIGSVVDDFAPHQPLSP